MNIFPFAIIGQDSRGLITQLGKYNRFADVGLNLLIPIIENVVYVNITEQMVDVGAQEIITKDSLNATIDAQIYFKIRPDANSIFNSQYNVFNCSAQIVALAKTSLRNIIGGMNLDEANSSRNKINDDMRKILVKETGNWGIEIVRAELKEVTPPEGVQEIMNKVVIAQKQKIAAIDFATATETEADGQKRAAIKTAEGERQSTILNAQASKEQMILEAQGNAEAQVKIAEGAASAIKLVNEAANKYFVGNAKDLKKLEVAQNVLGSNTKIIVSEGTNLINVLSDATGVPLLPINMPKPKSITEPVMPQEPTKKSKKKADY
jgi:regulator of protease activity HflC (stomatin/prohibitin superfamily)